jgi:subtilase family serine protease
MLRRVTVTLAGLALLGALPMAQAATAAPITSTRRACPISTRPEYVQCFAKYLTDANGVPLNGLVSGYGPDQFHTAYNVPTTVSGNHTIAIVDAFSNPNVVADLATYNAQFGLPPFPTCVDLDDTSCLLIVNQNAKKSPLPIGDTGWGLEIALDVQTAHQMCQNCRIILVETVNNSFKSIARGVEAAAHLGADAISNSYGDFGLDCHNQPAYDHPNIAVTVSSGDSGFGVSCPSNMSTVVSVGGTNLQINANNTWKSETLWGGTGSACSGAVPAQPWQQATSNWAAIGCSDGRGATDVSADADPSTGAAVYDSYGFSGWIQVGGTSLSSPLIAGIYALAGNASDWAYPAQSVYDSPASLHDITVGLNGSCSQTLQCHAGTGYDLPTGIGTPNGLTGF